MGDVWKSIASHPKDGAMFVAFTKSAGEDSIRVVTYNDDEDEFRVFGRNEFYCNGVFTHWCCIVPDLESITAAESQ